jgi:hypothetical protein
MVDGEMFSTEPVSPRVLTLEEANALLPKVKSIVEAQMELAGEIQNLVAELYRENGSTAEGEAEVVDITAYPGDNTAVRHLKEALGGRIRAYRSGWTEVEALGAVVKDPNSGLLDFYGRVDDRLVWLCWQYGEESIDYYHELHSGFDARKPLADVRKRMLN